MQMQNRINNSVMANSNFGEERLEYSLNSSSDDEEIQTKRKTSHKIKIEKVRNDCNKMKYIEIV